MRAISLLHIKLGEYHALLYAAYAYTVCEEEKYEVLTGFHVSIRSRFLKKRGRKWKTYIYFWANSFILMIT